MQWIYIEWSMIIYITVIRQGNKQFGDVSLCQLLQSLRLTTLWVCDTSQCPN